MTAETAAASAVSPPRRGERARAFLKAHRPLLVVTIVSLLFTAPIPILNTARHGDLANWFSDHVHHPFATWVMFEKGTVIYTKLFREIWDGSSYPEPLQAKAWGQMPGMAYPPGVFVLFLPTSILGKVVPMTLRTFGVINILYLLVLAHLAFFAVLLALQELPQGSRAVMALLAWLTIMALALDGFFDPVYIGAGAMSVRAAARKKPGAAMVWLCIGALTHFRMAAFAPIGFWAAWKIIQDFRSTKVFPWKVIATIVVTGVLVIGSFIMMYPATGELRSTMPEVLSQDPRGKNMVLGMSLVVAVTVAVLGDLVSAAMVLACLGLALVERQNYFWHAAALLAPMISIGAFGRARQPSVARAVLIPWYITLSQIVWRDWPWQLMHALTRYFK